MITVTFLRSDGKTFAIDDSVLGLVSAKGLDEANVEVYSQKAAVGDGDIITGQRVGSRTIEFVAKLRNSALNEVVRRAATSFFTASRTYDVYVTRYGDPRYASECRLDNLSCATENLNKPVTVKIALIMPEGYWLSADSFGKNIAGITGRCGYPYVSQSGWGRIYGVYAYAGTVYLDNDGDAEAYCQAVFVAQGTVTNPKLIAGGGWVRVLCTLTAGDVLVIDGKSKGVTINGVNAAAMVDKESNFDGIVFGIGTNSIGFTADVGSNVVAVNVYYNKRYMGV